MKKAVWVLFALVLGGCMVAPSRKTERGNEAAAYRRDIEEAVGCVIRNYAGYADKRERFGAAAIDDAATSAKKMAPAINSEKDCRTVINNWLDVFCDGHLTLLAQDAAGKWFNYSWRLKHGDAVAQTQSVPGKPSGRTLSDDTFLLVFPSFDIKYKVKIDELLTRSHAEIARRENLIIDLRGNSGGSDDSYGALSHYLYTQPVVAVGVDALATKENADAWQALLSEIPEMQDRTRKQVIRVAELLRSAPEGTFVSLGKDSTMSLTEVLPRPSHIAILIDRNCGSTTEQFLLEARQSKKVTMFGERTAGVLDYANVRFFRLPSGKRALQIPTTRSRRLPGNPVDDVGIRPDVLIENLDKAGQAEDGAIEFVQNHWQIGNRSAR